MIQTKDLGNCTFKDTESLVFSDALADTAGIFAILISISGFCLNSLFILAILTYRKTRIIVTSPFILSVSLADLWNSVFNLPVMAVRFLARDWMESLGEGVCRIYPLSFYGAMGASLLSLTLVTLNRAFILFLPNKMDKFFSNVIIVCKHNVPINSLILLLLCWLIPIALLLLPTCGIIGDVGLNTLTQSCTLLPKNDKSIKNIIYAVGFFLPCGTLLITNILMAVKVRKIREQAKRRTSFRPSEERKAEDKFIMMLSCVFISYACCYFPAMGVKTLDRCYNYPMLHISTYIINWCTVVVNPLVYSLWNEKYKEAYKNLYKTVCGFLFKDSPAENSRRKTFVLPRVMVEGNSSTFDQGQEQR